MKNFIILIPSGLRIDVLRDRREEGRFAEFGLDGKIEVPNLEELFDDHLTPGNVHTTNPSNPVFLASLLSGLYPREHHLWHSARPLDSNVVTLADLFDDEGYYNLLMNGHDAHRMNGLGAKFHEFAQGSLGRFFGEIEEMNDEGVPVFGVYQSDILSVPYMMSKFPDDDRFHDPAIKRANELADKLEEQENFSRQDAHRGTDHDKVPYGANFQLNLWKFYLDEIYRAGYLDTFDNPNEFLAELYVEGLNQFDQFFVDQLGSFVSDHQETRTLLVAESGSRFDYNEASRIDEVDKPRESLVQCPFAMINFDIDQSELVDNCYRSIVDAYPTILQEFELELEPGDVSGVSFTKEQAGNVYVETTDYERQPSETIDDLDEGIDFPRFGALIWSAVINQDGYKLYRRGEPILEKDKDRPLEEFLRVIFAKAHCEVADEEYIKEKAEEFSENDSESSRLGLITKLERQSRTSEQTPAFRELYDVDDDFHESDNLIDQTSEDNAIARELQNNLSERFPSPHELETDAQDGYIHYRTINIDYDVQESVVDGLGYIE